MPPKRIDIILKVKKLLVSQLSARKKASYHKQMNFNLRKLNKLRFQFDCFLVAEYHCLVKDLRHQMIS